MAKAKRRRARYFPHFWSESVLLLHWGALLYTDTCIVHSRSPGSTSSLLQLLRCWPARTAVSGEPARTAVSCPGFDLTWKSNQILTEWHGIQFPRLYMRRRRTLDAVCITSISYPWLKCRSRPKLAEPEESRRLLSIVLWVSGEP